MSKIISTAPCRFCGQMVQLDTEEKLTQPQAEEKATMSCTCPEAVEYQKEKQRKEKAMKNVSVLFGEDAAPEKRAGEGIVNILRAAVEEIYTGGLAKVTLNLRGVLSPENRPGKSPHHQIQARQPLPPYPDA